MAATAAKTAPARKVAAAPKALHSVPAMTLASAGATRPEQIRQNAAAGSAWQPTAAEVAEVSEIFAGR